ncbi:hypothetical protein [Methylobacterium nigriterrae]|uniref:hypothetical protein n=1 Tax=Methylobacterium nigriterrae TaxID=3127512 RepID=UPI0030134C25
MTEPAEVLSRFESLGDNCEFGFVQRHYGLEQSGLLRWAIVQPDELAAALHKKFADLYELANLAPAWDTMVVDRRYGLQFNSKIVSHMVDGRREFVAGSDERAAIHADEARKLEMLRDRLIQHLDCAGRIFVYKRNAGVTEPAAAALSTAIASYNPANVLLVVDVDGREPGSVRRVSENWLQGSIDRFAPYERAGDVSHECWLEICRRTLDLMQTTN